MASQSEIDKYYEEIIKGCDKVSPDNEALIKEVIGLTLSLHNANLTAITNERDRVLTKG
jgi:hypothetical protein